MMISDSAPAIKMMTDGLRHTLNKAVINTIIDDAVEGFRKTLVEEVKNSGVSITLDSLESFKNNLKAVEDIVVHISVNGEEVKNERL
jgi:hypothetical protein